MLSLQVAQPAEFIPGASTLLLGLALLLRVSRLATPSPAGCRASTILYVNVRQTLPAASVLNLNKMWLLPFPYLSRRHGHGHGFQCRRPAGAHPIDKQQPFLQSDAAR
ncbi:hypothetical protein N656DRAFT_651122 [Canariomyces notabilis]|uniref:Uncharacterized protein n=1 Tax=Canariomyces notabilis TaxID=2074819 RepID=A0AAN6TF65_9PEZI|nr:hypothetical protein N656DRAFT_651122 [Canariomyces arenarius]